MNSSLLQTLPNGWNLKRLKWLLSSLESGRREVSDTEEFENGALSIGGEHIGWFGQWQLDNPRYVSLEYFDKMVTGRIQKNDVLLVKDGATIGKVAIAEQLPAAESAVNEHVFLLRFSEDNYPKFYFYFIQSALAQDQIKLEVRGSAQPGLNSEFQNSLVAPQPPWAQQCAIANFLDRETAKLDSLVAAKERLLVLLADKRRALITCAVTRGLNPEVTLRDSGLPWLGQIPAHWAIMKLKHVAFLKSGDAITSDSITESGEYPVYGGNGIRGYTSSFTHNGDYVLIGRQGALCGNINIASGRFWASEHAVVVYVQGENDFNWLGELLQIMNLNQYSQSAAQPGLAVGFVANLQVPIPPLPEQRLIIAHIRRETAKLDALKAAAERTIELLKERRTALIAAAVTGQIGVN